MKAIVQDKYGSPDGVAELKIIDEPVVTGDEVLVRVSAATARWSWDIPGLRYAGRLAVRLRKPRNDVPGLEVAGQVVAVGTELRLNVGPSLCAGSQPLAQAACPDPNAEQG